MSVVSVNFTKITAERKKAAHGKVSVANNVMITSVKKAEISLGSSKQDCLKFGFEFASKAEPEIGLIQINGEVIFIADSESVKAAVEAWENKKPLKKELVSPVINAVLRKCNIEALILSQTMNLPAPIKLPVAKVTEATKKD